MPENSATSQQKIKVGIECEQLESQSWGIGRIISKTLQEIAKRPELRNEFRFYLYFKSRIPDLPFLNNPIFEKIIVWQPLPYKSFVLYYYVFLPIKLWFSGLWVMFYPNYMLPIIHPPFIPSLVLLTDDIWYEMRSPQQRFHHRLAYWVFGYWGVWCARRFMAISETSKRELIRLFGIAPEHIAVNPLAADTPDPNIGIPLDRPYLLSVGQAFPRRHLRETLFAFERIAPEFPELDFVIIGPDKYNPPVIATLVSEINHRLGAGRIRQISHVTDEALSRQYANGARGLTYISSREAFGLPPLEGLAHGAVPIIADNALGHEIFGDAAFFVSDPRSIGSIETTLRDALTNISKRERILAAKDGILSRFTWKKHSDHFLAIIRNLCQRN